MTVLLGIFLFLLAVAATVVLQGLRRIPADPPHKAAVTRFGKRTGEKKDEGWRWFFLYPWVTGGILVDMRRKNLDLTPEDVRTPEMAEIEVGVSVTWKPNPRQLIDYLNSGGEVGVNNILSDIVEAAVRETAANPKEEPFTWEEAVKMRDKFLAKIVAAIVGSDDPTQLETLAADLRRGNGTIEVLNLGIILSRLNVTSIKPKGELAKAAELEAKELRERKAEVVEVETDLMKAKQLTEAAKAAGETLSLLEAYRITLEWKTAREGHGFVLPGVAPVVAELARTILGGRRP